MSTRFSDQGQRGGFIKETVKPFGPSSATIPRKILIYGYDYEPTEVIDYNVPEQMNSDISARKYGIGSQLATMVEKAFGYNPSVEIWACPLLKDTEISASGSIVVNGTVTEAGSLYLYIGGHQLIIPIANNKTAEEVVALIKQVITEEIDLPVIIKPPPAFIRATNNDSDNNQDKKEIEKKNLRVTPANTIEMESKGGGLVFNNINITQNFYSTDEELSPKGITLTITQFAGGVGQADIEPSLSNWGNNWFTLVISPFSDRTSLVNFNDLARKLFFFKENRPFQIVTAYNGNRNDYITLVKGYNFEHVVIQFVENSISPVWEIAAAMGTAMEMAANHGASDSYDIGLMGILADKTPKEMGFDEVELIMSNGGCTTKIFAGVVTAWNTITTYKTDSAGKIEKSWKVPQTAAIWQVLMYQLIDTYSKSPFKKTFVTSDGSKTIKGISPKIFKATFFGLLDQWESMGLLQDVSISKENTTVDLILKGIHLGSHLFLVLPYEAGELDLNWSLGGE